MDVRLFVDIDCATFLPGGRAILSGPITRSSNPALPPGRISMFGIEISGEGSNAPSTRHPRRQATTVPDYAPPKSCTEFTYVGDTLREIPTRPVAPADPDPRREHPSADVVARATTHGQSLGSERPGGAGTRSRDGEAGRPRIGDRSAGQRSEVSVRYRSAPLCSALSSKRRCGTAPEHARDGFEAPVATQDGSGADRGGGGEPAAAAADRV